jgi:hypothetical protein
MHRFWEILLGLDKGFLARDGELHWHFSPAWPRTALIHLGAINWLLGFLAVGALIWMMRRRPARGQVGALARLVLAPFAAVLPQASLVRAGRILWILGFLGLYAFLLSLLSGAAAWNLVLGVSAAALIAYVYRREGHSVPGRIFLGVMRAGLLSFLLALLNRPVVTLVESIEEPSVLAVLVDDTISMQVQDGAGPDAAAPRTRLEAVADLVGGRNAELLRSLAKTHLIKFYRFSSGGGAAAAAAEPIAALDVKDKPDESDAQRAKRIDAAIPAVVDAVNALKPVGNSTQVLASIRSVLENLQGQRVAGVVLLTDGRDTPAENLTDAVAAVKNFGVKVFPVPVGSENAPRNLAVRSLSVQDSAFKGDIVNVKAIVQGTGYEANHPVRVRLFDAKANVPLRNVDGSPADQTIALESDKPQTVEMQFKASQVGMLDVTLEAVPQPGEINDRDNRRTSPVEVLDVRINVLYVEGYPRWEYRYIKNEMIREPTINLSCYLQSADSGFIQEHSRSDPSQNLKYFPYSKFPESIEQLREADVVLFGDVNPQRLSDSQLQMIRAFVDEEAGGFGMIAGTRWSPLAYRNTPIQDLLPVTVPQGDVPPPEGTITTGFRPLVTKEGEDSSVFRFFADPKQNELYMKEKIQPIFWYFRGITPKPGLGEVYAEHPTDTLPGDNNRKAPLLVVGHFGAGRTLFSAIDDSWRWRFYTGETVFDTYWIQQLRYLARSKKLGSRGMTFTSLRDAYEVGEQVRLSLHVLNRKLLQQLPDQLGVEVVDANNQVLRRENLVRQAGQDDTYLAQFPADRIGTFTVRLPPITAEARELNVRLDVNVPAKELEQPQVDRALLNRIASETLALLPDQAEPKLIELNSARTDLLKIPSAARSIPRFSDMPLWDAPLALVLFVLLLTLEWVLRKVFGML